MTGRSSGDFQSPRPMAMPMAMEVTVFDTDCMVCSAVPWK